MSTSSRDMHGGSPVRLNKKGTRLHTPSPDPEARQSLKRKESLESGVRIATVWQQKKGFGQINFGGEWRVGWGFDQQVQKA